MQKKYIFFRLFIFPPEKKVIFERFFATASVRSRSLDQPLVPGVYVDDVAVKDKTMPANGKLGVIDHLACHSQMKLGQKQ